MKIENFFLPGNFTEYDVHASRKLKLKNIAINRNNGNELILIDKNGLVTKDIHSSATFLLTLLTEYISKTKLWSIRFSMECSRVGIEINLNTEYIKDYIDSSVALSMYMNQCFFQKIEYEPKSNLESYLPCPTLLEKTMVDLKMSDEIYKSSCNLFEYQKNSLKKMLLIEKDQYPMNIDITYKKIFPLKDDDATTKVYMSPLDKTISLTDKCMLSMRTRGGVLADEMGLGKTLTSLAIIGQNPSSYEKFLKRNRIYSKATVIIAPSHLVSQWESEIQKMYVNLKIIKILTKTHHTNITYYDIIKSDVIIISQQFLYNFKYYPTVKYEEQGYNTGGFLKSMHYFNRRMRHILNLEPLSRFVKEDDEISSDHLKQEKSPLFEHFMFRRVLLDESHEIFAYNIENNAGAQYLKLWVEHLEADFTWFISGTPVVNSDCLYNTLDFLKCKFKINTNPLTSTERSRILHHSNEYMHWRKIDHFIMKKKYIMEKILSKLIIRHRKIDSQVIQEVQLPEHEEEVMWINFTELERKLYDSKVRSMTSYTRHPSNNSIELQQLCCHILVSNNNNRKFGSLNEIDLDQMQDELREMHLNTINIYTKKLEKLDSSSQAYHMLKKVFTGKISESKYMITILDNLTNNKKKEDDDKEIHECTICLEEYSNPVMTPCGHLFCRECLQEYFQKCHKSECPNCKRKLNPNNEEIYCLKNNTKNEATNTPLSYEESFLKKYGSKLGTLILKVKEIISSDSTNRVIIFSQWDVMLRLIGKTLSENKINNSFVKGNVYCRARAINNFKKGEESQVIMLSLSNSASGTDFVEGSHVLFVEPINSNIEEIRSIESQAIARIHRIGQTKPIKSIRFLVRDTIEEQIYKLNYVQN